MIDEKEQFIFISAVEQKMYCYQGDKIKKSYPISTAKNGLGEEKGSECTPRGWHKVHSRIGTESPINSVFIGRKWTGEVYSDDLAREQQGRDWILTRIIQLDGLEEGRNKGGNVDSLERYIYIHGTPDSNQIDKPQSHGCIRMYNKDVIELTNWVEEGTLVCIE